ncbi:unnamed protein product [Adineta ricciae]|uniref:RUN domain-containing protein n=1 Tax=Adineta ricciae TaxID=249248 RepID=A0A814XPY7_ADIRI|nr:unnamed protein product [Adineta ricciae]CAF1216891.1 unnamed protein product [Adineta ricciae]
MDDSTINPLLLTSSAHLENVEQLIRNLEKQTLDLDNFEDILSNRNRQELITKSFTAVSSDAMGIDDTPEDNFLLKSISLTNTGELLNNENLSMDSLFNQRDIFENDDAKKQQTPPVEQSLLMDQDGGFTWDDQYDTRANYRLTFSTDKAQHIDPKLGKSHKHKHHHHHHQHRHRSTDFQTASMLSDDGISSNVANNMNDWSMRSSVNALEQSMEQDDQKPTPTTGIVHQQTAFIRSQSHPTSFSPQQQLPTNTASNTSPNSSTTSSSSSASLRRMKDSQRTTSGIETKETRPQSPLSLYKIFQQKSQSAAATSINTPRSAFQFYRQQSDSVVPNDPDNMTISGERMMPEKSRASYQQKQVPRLARPSSSQVSSGTDQAIQTSIFLDSTSNSQMNSRFQPTPTIPPKSESYDYLSTNTDSQSSNHLNVPSRPSPFPNSSSSIHKSLPDLAFISQYSKELPRSRTTSPSPLSANTPVPSSSTMNPTYASSSSTVSQQEPERPRTLKAIKRYKNSKHSTEPLGVFYSPQLRKTFAAVPASAVINGSSEAPTVIKMKLPPPSSYPIKQQQQQQASTLKSCLKHGSRASSCDIQAMLQDRKSPAPTLVIPEPASNQDSSPSSKRRSSEADMLSNRSNNLWPSDMVTTGSSNDLNHYVLPDYTHGRRSDHDLMLLQQNQTKKSVSFSENIAKHLMSPCNPAIKFDPAPEIFVDDTDTAVNDELAIALHGDKDSLARRPTARYGEMRRCQTDIIVVDRIHHLHSFTESPPNEFNFQETDSLAPDPEDEDDQTIMERTHVNIIPDTNEPAPSTPATTTTTVDEAKSIDGTMTASNDKENKTPEQSMIMNASTVTLVPTNDPTLNGFIERTVLIVKRVFEIKLSGKSFFLANENNSGLDKLLKDDLCTLLQDILEHGLKPQAKDAPSAKQLNIWKIVEIMIDQGSSLQVFHEVKKIAQNASPYWLYKFQAFIFSLLNKNELINWLYHFMKQKEILQRYYQPREALILVASESTFKLFDRIMVQLEKLSPLAFRLVYKPDPIPADVNEQLNTSIMTMSSTKNSARDWVMTISRRASRNFTQPIIQPTSPTTATTNAATNSQSNDNFRSTLSRKINSLFTKTSTAPTPQQRKTSSAVTAKLPSSKPQTTGTASPATARRPRLSNVFANASAAATTNKPVIVSAPKSTNGARTGAMRRGMSPSVVIAPSPPPTVNTTGTTPSSTTTATFQSKIPRPSLNVDKPKSARYRSTAVPPK